MRHCLISIILTLTALAPGVRAQTGERARPPLEGKPVITVIYPRDSQQIGPVDSTFILGSVTPGSTLRINGRPVEVYHTGGFLGWLPVRPGEFVFKLNAKNRDGSDSAFVRVVIADIRPIPADSGLRVREESLRPLWDRTVRPGDEVSVGFDGTVGCRARFRIIRAKDTLGPFPMVELGGRSLSDYSAYRRDELTMADSVLPAGPSATGRGRYNGLWRVPEGIGDDTMRVEIELRWKNANRGSLTMSAPGRLIPVQNQPPRVVELIDSIQILRTGPRLGYLAIHQPYGVRSRWWGQAGPWTILQPAPGYEAWIETEKTRLLPEGTPLPGSQIARLSTFADSHSVRLEVGTSERLPFKVTVDADLRRIRLLVFGATSNTDWIEQDPADQMIESVSWTQTVPQAYQVDITLRDRLWGYDARYRDQTLVVEFLKPPIVDSQLYGLTIAVDAGHSADPGAVGPTGLVEKDANIRIAQALKTLLESLGARVVMTRTADEDVPLYSRPAIAHANHADLFVSVHNNAVPDGVNPRERNGTATYYYHPFSRELATAVHRRVRPATGLDDYGLTQGNFAVIRPTQYPSILVECAFIILPEQEELLDSNAFVARTADGIAAGILDFVKTRLGL